MLPESVNRMNDEEPVHPRSDGASFRECIRQATRQIESRLIMDALERNRWNRRRTAEALQISYRSLMYKMKRCNLRDGGALPESGE